MGTNRHDEDDELERLLEGSADAREQLPELAIFVDDLQAMPAPSPGAEDLHVVAMMSESSRLLADKGDPVARPVSKVQGPASQASGLPMRRSTPMVKLLLAKVMAPLVAVFTLMGGLAYAQALPDPLQDVVADAGGAIGLDLPDSDDGDVDESVEIVDAEDPLDEVDEAEDEGEIEDEADSNNSGPGGGGDEADDDSDNSGPGSGEDESDDDDNSGSGGDDEAEDDSDNSGGDDDEADDDSDNSGPGGGGDESDDDDNSGSGGSGDDGSDDEADEGETED